MIRSLIAVLLVAIGGLLSVPAALAVWEERQILNENRFIATTDEVFNDPDVQVAMANRLTDAIMSRADIQNRISAGLQEVDNRESGRVPEGIALLEGPLTRVARESIYRVVLKTLQDQPLANVREAALRGAHRALMAVIKQEGPLEVQGSKVVLDLQPMIASVINELAGQRGTEFFQNVNLPEDTGKIVITEEANHPRLWTLARWIDDINPMVPIIATAILLLATVISRNRRRTLISVGITVAVVAGLAMLAIAGPLENLATSWPATPEGEQAAESVYSILTDSFRRQELFVVLVGLGIAAGASLAGDERFKSALRSKIRGRNDGEPLLEWMRSRAMVLRMAGLSVGALFLILWPDPSTRLTVTVLALAALYLAILWVLTSDATWARKIRQQAASLLESKSDHPRPSSQKSAANSSAQWIGRRAGWLRLIGIAAAAVLLVVLPSFSYGTFLLIVAALLLYLAAVDFAATNAG